MMRANCWTARRPEVLSLLPDSIPKGAECVRVVDFEDGRHTITAQPRPGLSNRIGNRRPDAGGNHDDPFTGLSNRDHNQIVGYGLDGGHESELEICLDGGAQG